MKDNTPIGVFGMFLAAVVLALVCQFHASACLWDADTLADEQNQHPTLAGAILNPTTDEPVDAKSLTERIQQLRAEPHETDAGWWNNLAGAYVRLGQPGEAVKILEPLTNTFSNDYGIHANLGTAYHLLKRYSDAEREIARDLEINPDAHFGLEKYHLALLHYLIRDEHYRLRHVFVDEFTYSFLTGSGFRATDSHLRDVETNIYVVPENPRPSPDEERLETELKGQPSLSKDQLYTVGNALYAIAESDKRPGYRAQWNMFADTNLEKGVIYMASLNKDEPAWWVMLGMLGVKNQDKNLTVAAFRKAISLGSIQASLLRSEIE